MDFLYIVSLGIGKAFHQWRNPAEDVTLLCFGWCYSDRGVHLRPYDFATEEAHQDFEDRAEKKQGERRRLRLASNDGAGKCSSGLFFLVIVDPFNTWLSILLVSTSLIQLHPVSDFALRRSGEKPAPEFMKWDDAVAVLKNDASKARNIFVLLKIRRGPKLEGCAFANFGYSSGARRNETFWDLLQILWKDLKTEIAFYVEEKCQDQNSIDLLDYKNFRNQKLNRKKKLSHCV